jgi:hypothetical protein
MALTYNQFKKESKYFDQRVGYEQRLYLGCHLDVVVGVERMNEKTNID